jgi:hypothetical protein
VEVTREDELLPVALTLSNQPPVPREASRSSPMEEGRTRSPVISSTR